MTPGIDYAPSHPASCSTRRRKRGELWKSFESGDSAARASYFMKLSLMNEAKPFVMPVSCTSAAFNATMMP